MARQSTARGAVEEPTDVPGGTTPEPDPPVYDERGNVRPKGTPGARPMTYAERVEIARRIVIDGEHIVTAVETPIATEES